MRRFGEPRGPIRRTRFGHTRWLTARAARCSKGLAGAAASPPAGVPARHVAAPRRLHDRLSCACPRQATPLASGLGSATIGRGAAPTCQNKIATRLAWEPAVAAHVALRHSAPPEQAAALMPVYRCAALPGGAQARGGGAVEQQAGSGSSSQRKETTAGAGAGAAGVPRSGRQYNTGRSPRVVRACAPQAMLAPLQAARPRLDSSHCSEPCTCQSLPEL